MKRYSVFLTLGIMFLRCGSGGGGISNISTIEVSPVTVTIGIGSTQQFTATAKDSGGNVINGVSFTWASSDTAVATVDTNGLATGLSSGTAEITATADSVTGSATLTVKAGGGGMLSDDTIVFLKPYVPKGELGGIYLINIDGTGETHVPNTNFETAGYEYATKYDFLYGLNGDRSKIIVGDLICDSSNCTHKIYFLDPSDGTTTEIASQTEVYDPSTTGHITSASITPDNSTLVYAFDENGNDYYNKNSLFKKTIGGSEANITPQISDLTSISRVTVSPNGTKILMEYKDTTSPVQKSKLVVLDMNGTLINDLGEQAMNREDFTWLDDTTIVYCELNPATDSGSIVTMKEDGTNPQTLSTFSPGNSFVFSLSPDRTKMLLGVYDVTPTGTKSSWSIFEIITKNQVPVSSTLSSILSKYNSFIWGKEVSVY